MGIEKKPSEIDIPIDRDIFLRKLLRDLSGTLETVVGVDEAAGFISLVGQHIGDWMNEEYRKALGQDSLSLEQVKDVLVDLKKRIQGDFHIESADDQKIILGNKHCPFGDKVIDRPTLCMMTSNVFGTITAENLGYAKVCLDKTIATGSSCCHITVFLQQDDESDCKEGREYFQS